MLTEFHQAFGQPFGHGDIADSRLRIALHLEENRELIEALLAGDLTATAHELADVVYVAYGTAHSLGIPLDRVIVEVHRANMSKIGPDGPKYREDGKLLKPPSFRPADVAAVLSAPLPAVPDGEDETAFALPTTTALTDRKIAVVELRGLTACRCEAAWRDRGLHEPMHGCVHEYREDVDVLANAAPGFDGEDLPARLDAAAEALEALHSHGLGYELRQVADQLRDGDGGTPELRAAVAAALALPTEPEK